MQQLKKYLQRAADRFMASKFAQKGVLALVCLTVSVGEAMAASKGAAGFTKATQEVSSYQTPVSNLMKAIARRHRACRRVQRLFQDAER